MPTTPSERAAAAKRSGSRPVIATRAPACVNTSAAARPMPLDPPVISTTAFFRSMRLSYFRSCLRCEILPPMKSLFITLCFSFAAACAQDVTVQVDGNLIGTRGAINLESGNGIVEVCRDEGSVKNRITCTPSYNSALISTHDSVHNNEHFCFSSNQTTQYTCSLPYKTIAAYQAGMTFVLVVDAACRTSCTLNIDSLGIVQIKM